MAWVRGASRGMTSYRLAIGSSGPTTSNFGPVNGTRGFARNLGIGSIPFKLLV